MLSPCDISISISNYNDVNFATLQSLTMRILQYQFLRDFSDVA